MCAQLVESVCPQSANRDRERTRKAWNPIEHRWEALKTCKDEEPIKEMLKLEAKASWDD